MQKIGPWTGREALELIQDAEARQEETQDISQYLDRKRAFGKIACCWEPNGIKAGHRQCDRREYYDRITFHTISGIFNPQVQQEMQTRANGLSEHESLDEFHAALLAAVDRECTALEQTKEPVDSWNGLRAGTEASRRFGGVNRAARMRDKIPVIYGRGRYKQHFRRETGHTR